MNSTDTSRPTTVLICALGGEGGGVLSQWLFETALQCGHSAQSTSIPGVAQRTGATTYYLEIHPVPDAALGERKPVFSLYPVPGALDLMVSSELLETVRQIGAGMVSPERTTVISSSSRALTVAEKMQMGDGRASDEQLLAVVRRFSREARVFDMDALARESGTAISAVMLGTVAASGLLPFPREADLKCRASRHARVRSEVKASPDELLRIYDHFKPGVPEFAALLPPRMAQALTRWDRRRAASGKGHLALPLKIATHSVSGFLVLRTLAGLKWLRRRGHRFAAEQDMIERWLGGVVQGARTHWRLGHEIALCGRLIKGYGTTNERGKDNLLHVLAQVAVAAHFESLEQRADAIRAARDAALADDAGKALDDTLVQHGARARPVRAQPIQWYKRRPDAAA